MHTASPPKPCNFSPGGYEGNQLRFLKLTRWTLDPSLTYEIDARNLGRFLKYHECRLHIIQDCEDDFVSRLLLIGMIQDMINAMKSSFSMVSTERMVDLTITYALGKLTHNNPSPQ